MQFDQRKKKRDFTLFCIFGAVDIFGNRGDALEQSNLLHKTNYYSK
jgi:hypothetical protein